MVMVMRERNKKPKDNEIIFIEEYPKFPEDINKQFGHLKVLYQIECIYADPIFYVCECDCGNEVIRSRHNIHRDILENRICSCKTCMKRYLKDNKRGYKHGNATKGASRLYTIWASMKDRCSNPKNVSYEHYGARGIKVCEEWNDFIPFYEWSTKNGYMNNLTIDRIDNDKGYSPGNCRWATTKEQSRNTSKNSYFVIDGKTIVQKDLAKKLNVNVRTLISMAIDGRLKYDYWNRDINEMKTRSWVLDNYRNKKAGAFK